MNIKYNDVVWLTNAVEDNGLLLSWGQLTGTCQAVCVQHPHQFHRELALRLKHNKGKSKGKVKVLGIAPLNERSRYQKRFYNRGSGGWLALAIVSRRKVAAIP